MDSLCHESWMNCEKSNHLLALFVKRWGQRLIKENVFRNLTNTHDLNFITVMLVD